MLRGELDNLKECQLKYFTFSITATGIILGIISRLDSTYFSSTFYLLPLTILIPAWLVFFDKAKTITRIVAYYRFLESIILNNVNFNFIGWENSIMRFRDWEVNTNYNEFKNLETFYCAKKEEFNLSQRIINKIKGIKPPVGSYWFLVNLSFSGLIAVCVFIPLIIEILIPFPKVNLINYCLIVASIMLFYAMFITNFVVIYRSLIGDGRHSYTTNMKIWCEIFKIDYCRYIQLVNNKISIDDLFTKEFMESYTTDYSNFHEMVTKFNPSKFKKEALYRFLFYQDMKDDDWNEFILQNTKFKDWTEMLKKAKIEYLGK